MTQWELLSFTVSGMESARMYLRRTLHFEVAEPCVAQVSLVEESVVGDTVGTTQLHSQCVRIGNCKSLICK